MSLNTIRQALVAWVRYVTGYDAEHVFWADQSFPKVSRPFVMLRLSSINPLNQDYIGFPDSVTGARTVSGDRESPLFIQCFGTSSVDPLAVLLDLHMSLNVIAAYKLLSDARIAYIDDLLPPTDTSTPVDKTFERRANMDLLMRFPYSVSDPDAGVIESVEITGEYKDVDGSTVAVQEITIP